MYYRKLEKLKFLDRQLCSKKSQYIISLLIAPSEGGKGFSPKKISPFEHTHLESASHPGKPSKKAPKHPTSPNPQHIFIGGG